MLVLLASTARARDEKALRRLGKGGFATSILYLSFMERWKNIEVEERVR